MCPNSPSKRSVSQYGVLASFAVDQAAALCSCGHENDDSAAGLVCMSWTATGNAYDRHMECVESGRRREDVAPVHWRVHQAGLHRWRPGLSTALQRPVRPDDMVRAAQEVDVPAELVGATGVAGRATAQVRRALANREGETLNERGVQGLGILRLPQRSLQRTRRADPPAPFDSADAIVPPSLEHVTRDARRPKEALNHPNVVLEPIGRDQRESHHASAEDNVVEDGRGVSRGAAAEHAPGPQSGTHRDGRTQPCGGACAIRC